MRLNQTGKMVVPGSWYNQLLLVPESIQVPVQDNVDDQPVFIDVSPSTSALNVTSRAAQNVSQGSSPPPTIASVPLPPSASAVSRRRQGEWERQKAFLEKTKVTRSGRVIQYNPRDS